MKYAEQIKSPKWQKKRLEILSRDEFTCQLCGDTETQLHVHHKKYFKNKLIFEYDNKYLITYCCDCHTLISSLSDVNIKKAMKFPAGEYGDLYIIKTKDEYDIQFYFVDDEYVYLISKTSGFYNKFKNLIK